MNDSSSNDSGDLSFDIKALIGSMKEIVSRLILMIALSTQNVVADSRSATISLLEQIPNGLDSGLQAWINDGQQQQFELGETVELHFSAETEVFLSIAHVDSDGILTLFEPQFGSLGNKLKAGMTMTFPAPNSGVQITIEPPLGHENIYFVATRNPLSADVFFTPVNSGDEMQSSNQPEDSTHQAQRFLSDILTTNSPEKVSVIARQHKVVQRPGMAQYTRQEIVGFFSRRATRSITNARLDADIRFESNAATLTSWAKLNLDVWGESFMHPYLANARFQIGGHTDDVGDASSNLRLSRLRAEAVQDYLTSKFGIHESRLIVKFYGESSPRVEGASQSARAANRRVEFRQIND